MTGGFTWWEWLLTLLAIVAMGFAFVRLRRAAEELAAGELIASVGILAVRVTYHDGQRVVRLTNEHGGNDRVPVDAVLTPAQAREFAQWLRIAAARGRTLAEARRNASRHASAPMAP